jgi:hypothetical protein
LERAEDSTSEDILFALPILYPQASPFSAAGLTCATEPFVLLLLIILLLTGITLGVLLWVGTVFLQGYFYTEPNPEVYWAAPATGGAIALFLLVWCILDVNSTEGPAVPYDTLFQFSATEDLDTRPPEKIWVVRPGTKEPVKYESRPTVRGNVKSYEYVDPVTQQRFGSTGGVEAILVEDTTGKLGDKGAKVRFTRDKESGKFVGPDGWILEENNNWVGARFRTGLFLGNVLLNLLHLALWFVCLWLLLRFQWAHALGLAFVLWLVMTLAVLPVLMSRCAAVAQPQPASSSSAGRNNTQAGWTL